MKIVLTNVQRKQLTALAPNIKQSRSKFANAIGAIESLERERETLEGEIDRLENSAKVTDAMVSKLGFKREKLRLTQKRLAEAGKRSVSPMELNQYLMAFGVVLKQILRPIHDQIEADIIRRLKRDFPNGIVSPAVIGDSPRMKRYVNCVGRNWGFSDGNQFKQGGDALKIIDALLAGKLPFALSR